jgi:hypothetical protein
LMAGVMGMQLAWSHYLSVGATAES